jgi:hypothetical protein
MPILKAFKFKNEADELCLRERSSQIDAIGTAK